jgi:uncharacterized protein YjbI with pentapeptide repeats
MKEFSWLKKRNLVTLFIIFALLSGIRILYNYGWSGLKEGNDKILSVTETIIEKSQKGVKATTKTTDTVKFEPAKTLWDWMGLFLAPATLAGLGFWFQYSQEKTKRSNEESEKEEAEKRADQDRKRIIDQQHESALQDYFETLSEFLVNKRLKQLLLKSQKNQQGVSSANSNSIDAKNSDLTDLGIDADAALNVIKARTLSLLRLFQNDIPRKASVLSFLGDTNLLTNLNLDLSLSNFKDADLRGADLRGADLRGADLRGANLTNTNLTKAKLFQADLTKANLFNANLTEANLSDAQLIEANLFDTKLMGAKLFRTNLSGANLSGANLTGAKLHKAKLLNADLTYVNLTGAKLFNASLSEANLNEADLSNADLRDADFSNADLGGADFSNTSLYRTNLTEANLSDVVFTSADLSKVIGILPEQIWQAINWQTAKYDSQFRTRLGLDSEFNQ